MALDFASPANIRTLSISCHERGTVHFVDKESQKQLSNEKKAKRVNVQSPQRKRNRAVCPSVTEQHPGDGGCLCLLRFLLLFSAEVHFHPLSAPEVRKRAGQPPPRGQLCAGPAAGDPGPAPRSAPSSPRPGRGGSTRPGRCAPRAAGGAAPARAPPAENNGAGLEEKGDLPGRRRRPGGRGRRVHFARCQRAAAAAGADEGAPRERVARHRAAREGQREAGYERAGGARSRRAWPARGAAGGALRAGPRSRAGCPTRSCRPCRDPAMAVSARGSRRPWGAPSPRTASEKPRARARAAEGQEGCGCAAGGVGGRRCDT